MSKQRNTEGLTKSGPAIRELRLQFGYSLSELAQRIGPPWDKARLSKVETGALALNRQSIERIAAAFEMLPENLYLKCLRRQYPSLESTSVGDLLDEVAKKLSRRKGRVDDRRARVKRLN